MAAVEAGYLEESLRNELSGCRHVGSRLGKSERLEMKMGL